MEHVSSVRPTGKFPEKVENLKRWSRFPGWNFRTECRVPFTFLVVCTSFRSTVGHPVTYRGLRPNGTTFYQSEIPLLLPPKFPGFFRKWKAPCKTFLLRTLPSPDKPPCCLLKTLSLVAPGSTCCSAAPCYKIFSAVIGHLLNIRHPNLSKICQKNIKSFVWCSR